MSDVAPDVGGEDLPPDQQWEHDDGDDLEMYFLYLLRRPELFAARRYRLVLCGCCRRHWGNLPPDRRAALETAERFADGRAEIDDLNAARQAAWDAAGGGAAGAAVAYTCYHPESDALDAADSVTRGYLVGYESEPDPYKPYRNILRCVVGNPFRPVAFSSEWRTDTAVSLAAHMYESRDFSAMPILADALQDAGCDSDDILNHCRDTNAAHVRGCWVVDLVLGKQ